MFIKKMLIDEKYIPTLRELMDGDNFKNYSKEELEVWSDRLDTLADHTEYENDGFGCYVDYVVDKDFTDKANIVLFDYYEYRKNLK
jgi:hypothetical protein